MKQENTYQKNGDIVTGAVAKNNRAPQYADDLMRGNEDIAKAAVAKNDALSPHAVEAIVCEIKKEFFKRFEEEFHTDSQLRDFCQDVRRRFGEAVYNSVNPWQWLGEARTNGTPCKGCKYVQFFPDQCPCVGCTRNQTHNDFYVMSENTAERLKTFAEELNGMQYGDEPKELWEKAKKNGCVVVFGCSDDLIEFRGAIDDELGCFEGGMYYFNRNGDFVNELEKDCLKASLKVSDIKEPKDEKIATEVTLMSSFGAADDTEDGYFVIPDGSGALVRFNNNRTMDTNAYQQRVYGPDVTVVPTSRGAVAEQIYLPVYGIVKENNAMLVVASKGDSNAYLSAQVSRQSNSSYNLCNFTFILRGTDTFYMSGNNSDKLTVFGDYQAICRTFHAKEHFSD